VNPQTGRKTHRYICAIYLYNDCIGKKLNIFTPMNEDIPYLRLSKLALMTAPLFGILGAVPAFAMDRPEYTRIISSFAMVVGVSLFYWAMNILLLRLFNGLSFHGKTILRYFLSIAISILAGVLAFHWFFMNTKPPALINIPNNLPFRMIRPDMRPRLSMPAIQAMSINIIILVLVEMIILKVRKQKIEHENDRLRLTNLEARHSQLKQQLHPHFLFNSLNTLKNLIRKEPEQAEDYLLKLSELLRFSIYTNKEEVVSVEKELELCVHYLHMQQVRFGEALSFSITVPASVKLGGMLPVYSLQLLAENAIKHNTLTRQQPLHIHISGDNLTGKITVSNNPQPKLSVAIGNGVGLSNLAERYRLLGKEELEIRREQDQFAVTIKVLTDEHRNNRG
jgi:two-component system, LytTR family, sensor kinase